MNAKIETPEMMIYAMASQIEDFDTVLHTVFPHRCRFWP
jgi:hypothetical protein